MKATINGITIEGTPQELYEYQYILDQKRRDGVYLRPPHGRPPDWLTKEMSITSGETLYCKNPLHCHPCNCS